MHRAKTLRRLLIALFVWASVGASAVPVTVGSFTFDLPEGWERAPADTENDTGGWMFACVKGVTGDAMPVVVVFSQENAPYRGEAQRSQYLKGLRDRVKAKHGPTFRSDKTKLAGVDTERLRFVEDGETTFYLSPYNNERVFLVIVTAPKPNAPFPPEADALLRTLKLSGPAYQPPKKVGFLDKLIGELDKVEKGLDDLAGALTGKKAETKPSTGSKPAETATRPVDSVTTGKPVDTAAAPPTFIAIDAVGKATATGLAEGDRVWAAPVTKAAAPLDTNAIRLPSALDLAALAKLQYSGGATASLAAMRELAGPLSPTEDAKLHAKWAPYLQMPPDGADEYFDKLAPILQETLSLRTAATTAAAEFDAAWEEAVIAASYESEDGVREALAIGDNQRRILIAIQSRLAELSSAAQKLGSPPNPIVAAAEARKAHAEAIKTTRDLLAKPPSVKGAWVLTRVTRTDLKPKPEAASVKLANVTSDTQYRYLATTNYTQRMGGADVRFTGEYLLDVQWQSAPALIPAGATVKWLFSFSHHRKGNDIANLIDSRNSIGVASDGFLHVDPRERRLTAMYQKEWGFEKGFMLGIVPGVDPAETGAREIAFVAPAGEAGKKVRLSIGADINACKDDYTLQGRSRFYRVFEYVWTTDPNAIANAGKVIEEGPADAGEKARADATAFHEANVLIIQKNLAREREDLAKETDPSRRGMIEMRIMQAETDLIAEQDLIWSIETGQIVHSRTPFDDYAHARFVQSIRENQIEMERFQRATAALQRLAGMLPSGEAEDARRFIDRQMTGGVLSKMDMDAVQKMAHALGEKVQGYAEQSKAKADYDEAWAQAQLETAERIKSTADKSLFVCSLFGGRGVMIAYQAATGYIEGGPTEAVLRTAAWCGTPAYVASEAYRGYYRTDENGNPRGWVGAAKDAATAYVLAKAFEYGASKARQWATGRGPEGLTAAERTQMAEFQRGRTGGELKAREFARAQADLERAARQGAKPEVIAKLQANCRKAASVVHADPHAKNFLKYKGDFHAQRAYNSHMRANHAEVEAKFHDIMAAKGWNRQPLKEFRNAASGDSVGMDHDIGLDEQLADALRLRGKPASVYQWQEDAQKAWDQAYGQVTGQSAKRSWETVTTSINSEAYKDLAWLSSDKAGIRSAWGQQAADVTRYKNWHMLNDKSLDAYTRLQEVSRGTAKDIGTKLAPLLKAVKPKNAQSAAALEQARRHWNKVQSILESYGNNSMDPVSASRRIREVCGGKDIPQIVDEAAMLLESLAKEVGK